MAGEWFVPRIEKVSRGRGDAPATAKAAYRAAERITDERTGEVHDYRAKGGVEGAFLLTAQAEPELTRDKLWNLAEKTDTRKNSVTARDLTLPLPSELTPAMRRAIAEEVGRFLVERYGVAVDVAIHQPHRDGDQRNHHAHILFTTRRYENGKLGAKTRELDDKALGPQQIEAIRQAAARATNRQLERANLPTRVDHRSYERRGIEREAGKHLGPAASAMERRGERTTNGDHNRTVAARNAEREALKAQARVIDLALKIEERKAEAERRRQEQARKAEEERRAKEAQTEREKRRFEAWANTKRAEQRSRQFDETGQLGNRHARERMTLGDRLEATYGPGKREARERLAQIEERQERGGVLYRLTGRAKRDREEAEGLRLTLKDTLQREQEQKGALERAQEAERAAQEAKHRREDRELGDGLQRAYERRERDGWQPLPDREPANDREKGEEREETAWERVQRLRAELAERERQQGRDGRDFERER